MAKIHNIDLKNEPFEKDEMHVDWQKYIELAKDMNSPIYDYIKDYAIREPNDTTFRYIPKYSDWLVDDCDYWIRKVEEKQKIRGGEI